MVTERPDYSFVVRDNEQAAANALSEGRYMDAFLLVHILVEALLRAFLRVDKPRRSFNQLVAAYGTYLTDQDYPKAVFVGELQQLNQRRNRIVHQLWQRGLDFAVAAASFGHSRLHQLFAGYWRKKWLLRGG